MGRTDGKRVGGKKTKEPGWTQLGLAGRNGPLVDADAACNLILMIVGSCWSV